ncbi:MAG: universal stress protein [Nitritalea sp.]
MSQFKTAMLGLDLSEMDALLLKKTTAMADVLGIERLYLIHVAANLELPEELRSQYPDLLAPVDEGIASALEQAAAEAFSGHKVAVEVLVKEGNKLETVLRWAKIKDVDLLISGRKEQLPGSGSLSKSLAEKAPCSVLFLTQRAEALAPQHLFMPMDFSSHSLRTWESAQTFLKTEQARLTGLHLFDVPAGYSKTGKSREEFTSIMEGHARKAFQRFLEKNKLPAFDCLFEAKEEGKSGQQILRLAEAHRSDFILMGSRGRSGSAAVLLGSTAEKLVHANYTIPMLILKQKGENMGFLEALFRL